MTSRQSSACELGLVMVLVSVYLLAFSVAAPHGDAMRIVRQVDAGALRLNPNHLLIEPLGYYAHRVANMGGASLSPLQIFAVISGVSTLVTMALWLFLLRSIGVTNWMARWSLLIGIFASSKFLSMAVSQYYFMVQMPFLVGGMYLLLDYVGSTYRKGSTLVWSGLLCGVAGTIEINNVILIGVLGVVLASISAESFKERLRRVLYMWIPAALVGLPVYLLGYFVSGGEASFVSWLASYEGKPESTLTAYYARGLSPMRVVTDAVAVVYNLLVGNILETASLGTVLRHVAFDGALEFNPDVPRIALSVIMMPLVLATMLAVLTKSATGAITSERVRLLVGWLVAYMAFNWYWGSHDDLFWVQTTPAVWVLMYYWASGPSGTITKPVNYLHPPPRWVWPAAGAASALLLILNTYQVVVPQSAAYFERYRLEHARLLRDGDLEILPGWDSQKWMGLDSHDGRDISSLVLMNMATAPLGAAHISQLSAAVEQHLTEGGRVVVARLFDLDHDPLPWYGIAAAGWPRSKIADLLAGYCHKPLATIGRVGFRVLERCPDGR